MSKHKAKELKGHLRNLIRETKERESAVGELLEFAIMESAKAVKTGKDHKRVADALQARLEQIHDFRDRYEDNDH